MVKSLKALQGIDTEKLAKAIEADAGMAVPDLRQALAQAKAGDFAAIHTPEQIATRKPGRPAGTVKTHAKVATNIRFDPDVLAALKATGRGWQTRVNELLRADIESGRLAKVG
ncbi:BrnA antitoxin family protein [Delftia sp. PS-11]|uniref:BrnA antitoxin family protein n=1 Tax=Delftia sp. PS-11 TaxID=2767222 RepID=UPI0032AF31C9